MNEKYAQRKLRDSYKQKAATDDLVTVSWLGRYYWVRYYCPSDTSLINPYFCYRNVLLEH